VPSLLHGSASRHCRSPKWSLKLVRKLISLFSYKINNFTFALGLIADLARLLVHQLEGVDLGSNADILQNVEFWVLVWNYWLNLSNIWI
jgi:hypothetical protein